MQFQIKLMTNIAELGNCIKFIKFTQLLDKAKILLALKHMLF